MIESKEMLNKYHYLEVNERCPCCGRPLDENKQNDDKKEDEQEKGER